MRKNTVRNLACLVLLALLTSPIELAFASSPGQSTDSSTSATTSSSVTADGITGTDPEPISPKILSILVTLLQLS